MIKPHVGSSALCRRSSLCRQPFLDLVHRRTIRRQSFRVFVHRRTIRRQSFLMFVHRRTIRRHTFRVLSVGELFAGNHFSFCPSANCSPAYISCVCPSASTSPATLGHGATREMVGAVPVCPPERPRSGVSIRKRHIPPTKAAFPSAKGTSPTRKSGVSIRKRARSPSAKGAFPRVEMFLHHAWCTPAIDGCALAGRYGRAHRHRPYQPPSNPSATQPPSF